MSPRILSALGLAALILGTAAAMKYAQSQGLIDADIADRVMQVVVGLVLAAYANLMPKQLGRPRGSTAAEAVAQSVRRVGGLAMSLGGLAWAAIWAFAPMSLTTPLGIAAVASATVITLSYGLWAWRRCRNAESA